MENKKIKFTSELHLFNLIFVAMGTLLLGVAGWIAISVAHIPGIDQKLDDFITTANHTFNDHELRLRSLEGNHHGQ